MTNDDHTGTDAGTTDDRTEQQTIDDLAAVGARLEDGGEAWTAALRAIASYGVDDGRDPADETVREIVAGQVYATLDDPDPAATDDVEAFVERFIDVYELDDAGAVDRLLGRESWEQRAYQGRLAFQGETA